jgi:hypothetical protein
MEVLVAHVAAAAFRSESLSSTFHTLLFAKAFPSAFLAVGAVFLFEGLGL